jgi:molybdopterin-guanine dinucleotide biosynthesis protein A
MTAADKAHPKKAHPKKAHPTTIRLSPETREKLTHAAKQQQRPHSHIIEEAVKHYLDSGQGQRLDMTSAQKMAALNQIIAWSEANVPRRSADDIDAEIRWIRGDE